jgi:hypothetical protein
MNVVTHRQTMAIAFADVSSPFHSWLAYLSMSTVGTYAVACVCDAAAVAGASRAEYERYDALAAAFNDPKVAPDKDERPSAVRKHQIIRRHMDGCVSVQPCLLPNALL